MTDKKRFVCRSAQRIPDDVLAKLAEASASVPSGQRAFPQRTATVLSERELQRLIIDGLSGKRVLPREPHATAVAMRMWEELDRLREAGYIVDIPASFP